jgi:hypothetical protein
LEYWNIGILEYWNAEQIRFGGTRSVASGHDDLSAVDVSAKVDIPSFQFEVIDKPAARGSGNKQMNNNIAQRHNVTKLRKEVKILNFFVASWLCA